MHGDLSRVADGFRCRRYDGTIQEIDASCVSSIMTYGSETWLFLVDVGLKFERAEIHMIRWMCGISLKDRMTNEELRKLVRVEPIITFIRSGRMRWYGHVMRKGDEDWVKKCMEYRVEGRIPVGRPRKTWLESVEADMAELEIDKEDVHDRSKWRRNVNVMKRKFNPIGKRTINRLYIYSNNLHHHPSVHKSGSLHGLHQLLIAVWGSLLN